MDTAVGAAQTALEETRRLIRALTPAPLAGRPLTDALGRLVNESRQLGLDAHLTVDSSPYPLPTPGEDALLRSRQEALASVRAHSGAGRVDLTLTYPPEAVSLDIVDTGRGFDPDHPIVRRRLRAALGTDPGITVVAEAPTGEDALTQADATGPDVVLMDLHLGPGINGAKANRLLTLVRTPDRALTPHKTQILQMVADGHSNQAIARALFIAEATVKSHLVQVFTSLGVDNRTAAVAEARRRGIVPWAGPPATRQWHQPWSTVSRCYAENSSAYGPSLRTIWRSCRQRCSTTAN